LKTPTEINLPEQLKYLVKHCETNCVAGCCGMDAFDFSPLQIASFLRAHTAGSSTADVDFWNQEIAKAEEMVRHLEPNEGGYICVVTEMEMWLRREDFDAFLSELRHGIQMAPQVLDLSDRLKYQPSPHAPVESPERPDAGSSERRTMPEPARTTAPAGPLLIRHEGHTPRERSTCGWGDRLISREDDWLSPAAWAHAVDIDGAKLHYHKRSTELYYVLDGSGAVSLDGVEQPVSKGSLVHIPPGVIHGARGRMRVLVVGIPDIAEDDYFEAEPASS